MNTAKLIRKLDWNGDARLYELSAPVKYEDGTVEQQTTYVIVSALQAAFDTGRPETFMFPATPKGAVINYGELEGSVSGRAASHATVLRNAGFELVKS